jgi:16S rRNA (cytosine967-C5)-methyltransferase
MHLNPHMINPAILEYLRATIISESHLTEILESISNPGHWFYFRVNLSKICPNDLMIKLSPELNSFYAISESNIEQTSLPNAVRIPVIGPNELPVSDLSVYCDKFAAEAIMVGADLFIPGVKHISRSFHQNEKVAVRLFLPNDHPQHPMHGEHVATGITAIDSNQFPKLRKGIIVTNTNPRYRIFPYRYSSSYAQGLFSEQTFGPMCATGALMTVYHQYLNSRNAETPDPLIFDLCAAPGHKSAAMAEWGYWQNRFWPRIISIDRSENRLQSLHQEIQRLGLQNIHIFPERLENALDRNPDWKQAGNFVLFDPPCSALGNRPKIFLEKTKTELQDYAKNQRRLLKVADQFVKDNGFLMYNTCTIPKEENEDMVRYAVEKLGYKIRPLPPEFHQFGHPGLSIDIFSKDEANALRRFYPTPTDGTGYFIALLQKSR